MTERGDRPTRTVVALVHNRFSHDSRVLNEATSLAAAGDRVVVVAVADAALPERETVLGFEVQRYPFDPVDSRFWRNRSRVSRPWRHRRTFSSWLRRRAAGHSSDRLRAALGMAGAVLLLPWVAITVIYHYGLRALDRPFRRLGRAAPSRVAGEWIEERMRRLVFSAHRPLRLRDWGRAVEADLAAGRLPVADIWHAHDLETLPLALGLRRRAGGRVVFDSHELFLEAAGRARLGRLRRWMIRTAEARWIHEADGVVTVNDAVASELVRRYGIEPPTVVRNCPPRWDPPEGFVSPLRAAVAAAGGDPARPIVIAHGTFQRDRGYEELLAATDSMSGLTIVFLGYGALERRFSDVAASDRWRGRLIVLPAVPPDALPSWLAGADLGACLIQPTTLNHRLSTPNKLFEAIAAGLPVVAADLPAIAAVVRSSGAGVLVDPTDKAAIHAAIAGLLDDSSERARLAGNARVAAAAELHWDHEVRSLMDLYDAFTPPAVRDAG